MRLWEVRTLVKVDLGRKQLFSRNVKQTAKHYFTFKTKYIYADNKDEAVCKYYDAFFKSVDYTKDKLKYMLYKIDSTSSYDIFNLPFWIKIINVEQEVECLESEVYENIETIKLKMTANDFRDWSMYGDTRKLDPDDFTEIFK